VRVVACLVEGNSIRATSRMTGAARNTVDKLLIELGAACSEFQDKALRNLTCKRIECDEIWSFVGCKEKNVPADKRRQGRGDVWTWVAIDAETKLVPTFAVGDRSQYMANIFIEDLASRLSNRVQLSSDALRAYQSAVDRAFGSEVDYGSIFKTFSHSELAQQRRYSPPDVVNIKRTPVFGNPVVDLISTSHVEKQNHTLRMHCRRLSRLTNAFSKKLENFKAAVALHYGYYNFCKTHSTIRCTPAMEAGVTNSPWTVSNLVEMIEG
jgi:IS1 family transposase